MPEGADPHNRVAWLGACSNPGFKACIVFYGGRIKNAFADGGPPPIELAGQMAGPLMGIFGNDDQGPSPADVDDYEVTIDADNHTCDDLPFTTELVLVGGRC